MDTLFRKIEKVGSSMGSMVDHVWIRILVITLLVIYNSGLFVDYNMALSPILNNTVFRLVLLILVVYLVPKNPTIAVLLVLTLACSSYYRAEHYENEGDEEDGEDEDDEHFTENKKNKGKKSAKKDTKKGGGKKGEKKDGKKGGKGNRQNK